MMARLEDLTDGSIVKGLESNEAVKIINVRWYGSTVIDVTYRKSNGQTGSRLVYREEEESLEIQNDNLPWSFSANGNNVKLASEAYRINLAHIFDPYLAIHTSSIEPLPHQ